MTLTIKPFEQILVEGATLAGINIGASTAAVKYQRAQAALQVASIATALASGDIASVESAAAALIKTSDPGVAKFISDLTSLSNTLIQGAMVLNAAVPLLSTGAELVATNVAAGITAIASQYPAA
jgi:hypothetical protein